MSFKENSIQVELLLSIEFMGNEIFFFKTRIYVNNNFIFLSVEICQYFPLIFVIRDWKINKINFYIEIEF